MAGTVPDEPKSWDADRRGRSVIIVRVHSVGADGQDLPDAVFTFSRGDPQYELWDRRLKERESFQQ